MTVAVRETAFDFQGAAEAAVAFPSTKRAAYGLLLLVLAMWIARFDRVIFALTTQDIKLTLGLTDTEIGSLNGLAWRTAYGIAAFPLGLFIDSKNRTRLLMTAVIAWSTFAVLTSFCATYWQMFVCRAGAGIAEAALFPASFSLICDLFPLRQRRLANLFYLGGSFLGASIGFAAGSLAIGWVTTAAPTFPPGLAQMPAWRLAFFATILPSAVLALLFLSASEPARQRSLGIAPEAADTRIKLGQYLRSNCLTVICLFFGLVAVGLGSDEMVGWVPSILARSYGWTSAQAGQWLSLTFLVGSLGGLALGGILTRAFDARWGELAPLQTLRCGAVAASLSLAAVVFVTSASELLVVAAIHITFAFVGFGVGPGMLMSIAPNHLRGQLYGMKAIVGTVVGAATPLLIGALSDHLYHGSGDGLRLALCTVLIPVSMLTVLSVIVVGRPFERSFRAAAEF